jgi:biotin transport system ATP-binding protein
MPDPTASDDGLTLVGAGYALGGKALLSELTLRLREKRIAVVGRNGSGKSTFLRLIAGLVAPTTGTVRVDGIDPAADRRAMLGRIGILFQNPDHQILFPTVEEELSFGLVQLGRSRAEARAEARALLAREGRAHWAEVPVTALSQGQRQVLCLLSVLAMAPATILLDEPFSGLDLPTAARMGRWFAALPQRLVIVTHDPAVAAAADRVIWLDDGRVQGDGTPSAVLPAYRAAMARLAEAPDTGIAGC